MWISAEFKIYLIPPTITREQVNAVYATEADLVNVALFGQTAASWRQHNPEIKGNIEQLVVLSNLESINALLIRQGLSQSGPLQRLNETAIQQLRSLLSNPTVKQLNR
jgi:hypothetical protein